MLNLSELLCGPIASGQYDGIGGIIQPKRTPRPVVVWSVTPSCNLRCLHCYASPNRDASASVLSRDEGFRLLDDLKQFDVPSVVFCGGEPLARWDTPVLLSHAKAIGLNTEVATNGVLVDEGMADRLAELSPGHVIVGLDGPRELHDKLRNAVGAFDRAVAAIERCRRRGIRVQVKFTVHSQNVAHIEEVFGLCTQLDVQGLIVRHLAHSGRRGLMQNHMLTAEQTRSLMDRLFALTVRSNFQGNDLQLFTDQNDADAGYALTVLERTFPERAINAAALLKEAGGNQSGNKIAAIDPTGIVHYDQYSWHYNCGNVRKTPFSKIWTLEADSRLSILRDRKSHLPPRCRDCRFLSVCNGNSRSRAEAATHNWLGFDPGCYLTPAERGATTV